MSDVKKRKGPAAGKPKAPAKPPKPVYGPLPSPKTMTMTFVPDFTQLTLGSPTYPTRLTLVLGAANTRPDSHECRWRFDFFIFSQSREEILRVQGPQPDELVIAKGSRALLFHDPGSYPASFAKPSTREAHGTFEHGVDMESSLLADDAIKTLSVTMRLHPAEQSKCRALFESLCCSLIPSLWC
jgi:hypothetical protein